MGPTGIVVGSDRSSTAIEAARTRARERALDNVTFQECDPATAVFDQPFDAIVGRYVLMFSPDPSAMLRGVAKHLRPGGIIAFHEVDWLGATSVPPAPTYDNCMRCIVETFQKAGTNPNMGLKLHSAFIMAGLPVPVMALSALAGGSDISSGIDLVANLAATMAPVMEQMGVISVSELDPDTLQERIRAEVIHNQSVVVGRYEIGAWARV